MAVWTFSSWKHTLLLLFLLVSVATSHTFTSRRYVRPWDLRAAVHPKLRPISGVTNSSFTNSSTLSRRQGGSVVPPSMDRNCQWRCTVATCGCDLTTRPVAQIFALAVSPYGSWDDSAVANETVPEDDSSWSSLIDRQVGGGFTEDHDRWTKKQVDAYLPTATLGTEELFSGNFEDLTTDPTSPNPEATVSKQARFTNRKAIQIGAHGLHGCTVATLMSNRGVWMAHFWQGYAMDFSNAEEEEAYNDDPDDADFKMKVINFMTGEGDQDPTNEGPSIDWSLFNQEGDNTQFIVFTPGKETWNGKRQDARSAMYYKKAMAMGAAVKSKVAGARTQVHLYDPMDYSYTIGSNGEEEYDGRDAALVDKTARGMNYFQFDGKTKWRLFAEYKVYRNQGDAKPQ